MTEIEKLAAIATNIEEMARLLGCFDRAFREFEEMRERVELFQPFEDPSSRARAHELSQQIMGYRQQIMHRQDDVTKFLSSVHLPVEWHVTPPPAIGGAIEVYNIFDAFICVTGDIDPRPKLVHLMDLLEKGNIAYKRLIVEYTNNAPSRIAEKVKRVPRHIGPIFSWLFPTDKQRGVLGWVLIAGIVALMLRYVFGIHLEDLGKLIVKWFSK